MMSAVITATSERVLGIAHPLLGAKHYRTLPRLQQPLSKSVGDIGLEVSQITACSHRGAPTMLPRECRGRVVQGIGGSSTLRRLERSAHPSRVAIAACGSPCSARTRPAQKTGTTTNREAI